MIFFKWLQNKFWDLKITFQKFGNWDLDLDYTPRQVLRVWGPDIPGQVRGPPVHFTLSII